MNPAHTNYLFEIIHSVIMRRNQQMAPNLRFGRIILSSIQLMNGDPAQEVRSCAEVEHS
jgi:hypothetical protein